MQFQIKRDTLLKSLSIAHNIIERKNTIPILANVLLETKNNVLSIVATDMDLIYRDEMICEKLKLHLKKNEESSGRKKSSDKIQKGGLGIYRNYAGFFNQIEHVAQQRAGWPYKKVGRYNRTGVDHPPNYYPPAVITAHTIPTIK